VYYHSAVNSPELRVVLIVGRVRRRATAVRLVWASATGASLGAGIAFGATVAARAAGFYPGGAFAPDSATDWLWPSATLTLFGGAVAACVAWATRPSLRSVAWQVDRHYNTRDALGNALELPVGSGPFVALQHEQAADVASRVVPSEIVGFESLRRRAGVWALPFLLAGALGAGLWMPELQEQSQPGFSGQQSGAVKRVASDSVRAVTQAAAVAAATLPEATRRDLESLERMESELGARKSVDTDVGRRAAGISERISQQLDDQAAQSKLRDESLRKELATRLRDSTTGKSEVGAALRAGDLEAAARAADELTRDGAALSQAERAQLAEDLDSLSKAIEKSQDGASPDAPPSKKGGPQSGKRDRNSTTSGPAESEQNQEALQQLKNAARDAARDLRQPPPSPSTQRPEKAQRPPDSRRDAEQRERSPGPDGAGAAPEKSGAAKGQQEQSSRSNQTRSNTDREASAQSNPKDQKNDPSDKTSRDGSKTPDGANQSRGGGKEGSERQETKETEGNPKARPESQERDPAARSNESQSQSQQQEKKVSEGNRGQASGKGSQGEQPAKPQPGTSQGSQSAKPQSGGAGEKQSGKQADEGTPPQNTQPPAGGDAASSGQSDATPGEAQRGEKPAAPPRATNPATQTKGAQSPEKPSSAGEPKPDQQGQPSEQREPAGGQPSAQRLSKAIKDLAKSGQDAKKLAGESQELRKQARELLEKMSPERKDEAMKLAKEASDHGASGGQEGDGSQGEGQRESDPKNTPGDGASSTRMAKSGEQLPGKRDSGGAGVSDDDRPGARSGPVSAARPFPKQRDLESVGKERVDARRLQTENDRSRVLAQWDAPPKPGDAAEPTSVSRGLSSGITVAAEGAQRAVDQQQVPAQYSDLVRRVFKRYVDRAAGTNVPSRPEVKPQ